MTAEGDFELVTLRNGSRAVRHRIHGEVMHPSVGPWGEANRLYVEQPHLEALLTREASAPLCIYDVGLGAAANAVAALTCASMLGPRRRRELVLVSFEVDLAPLRLALADAEGFPFLEPFQDALQTLVTDHQWHHDGLSWSLLEGDLLARLPDAKRAADLVYFDPFSPENNASLWSSHAFARLRARCAVDAQLITYSAATPTRIGLLLAGFFVGAGISIGTKSETTIASTKLSMLEQPLGASFLARWKRSSARAPHGDVMGPEIERAVLAHPQWAAVAGAQP